MRKHTARHWLHACLDLLPVLLIPVFMIYSHRHTMTKQTTVDIQYKYESNEVNSLDDLIVGNIYTLHTKNIDLDSFLGDGNYIDFYILTPLTAKTTYLSIEDSAIVYTIDRDTIVSLSNEDYSYYIYTYYNFEQYDNGDPTITYTYSGIFEDNIIIKLISFNLTSTFYISKTDYNEIESVDVNDETSSIMNVFMDNFNTAVDKYFNMGNVFGMTNVYQWFNTNIFGGNAPVVIYSVWNIVLYEFVMDLLFLLYGLFMWFIDMCKRLMDKPLDSIK